ncbi:MAG: sulfatase/phosphatase domain-containing protein, partial [Verrucomicrobiota bacterium]
GFRGGKRLLYEGGLRIPFIVRWPGKVEGERVSDLIFNQVDVFPTLAAIASAPTPDDLDGMSILPELLGQEQKKHDMLYWEYGGQTAVRKGLWKAVQPKKDSPWELYDLSKDISETTSVADRNKELLDEMIAFAKASHTPVQSGTYYDPARARHERDRWAKWGETEDTKRPTGKVNRIKENGLVPWDEMKLVRFSSENRSNDKQAIYAIDGKPHTVWHSRWDAGVAEHPHELVIDLGKSRAITGFRYLARQDKGWNGAFAKTQFLISDDPESFVPESAAEIVFEKDKAVQSLELERPVSGRYVLVRALSEVDGRKYGSIADIGVITK